MGSIIVCYICHQSLSPPIRTRSRLRSHIIFHLLLFVSSLFFQCRLLCLFCCRSPVDIEIIIMNIWAMYERVQHIFVCSARAQFERNRNSLAQQYARSEYIDKVVLIQRKHQEHSAAWPNESFAFYGAITSIIVASDFVLRDFHNRRRNGRNRSLFVPLSVFFFLFL